MTHEELLVKISDLGDNCLGIMAGSVMSDALRAVVELHKPIEEDGKLWCEHEVCYNHIEFLERDDCDCSYPCPTIQVIQEDLK